MVAVDEYSPVRQGVAHIVAESEFLEFEVVSPKQCLVSDGTKGDNNFESRHRGQLGLQVAVTLANFGCCRLVRWWQATHGIGDATIAQLHGWIGPVIGAQRLCFAGKTEAVQGGIEQFAGDITGEGAARPVGAFFAGAEADNKQFCIKGAEGRNRQGVPVGVALANVGKVLGQSWTGCTASGILKS